MEDAVILNKASVERGFGYGSIYKTQFIELDHPTSYFCRDPTRGELADYLDFDGLPFIGRDMQEGEPLFCYYKAEESKFVIRKFQGKERCYVDSVKRFSTVSSRVACRKASVTFRIPVSVLLR